MSAVHRSRRSLATITCTRCCWGRRLAVRPSGARDACCWFLRGVVDDVIGTAVEEAVLYDLGPAAAVGDEDAGCAALAGDLLVVDLRNYKILTDTNTSELSCRGSGGERHFSIRECHCVGDGSPRACDAIDDCDTSVLRNIPSPSLWQ